jgi:hypothetical protein
MRVIEVRDGKKVAPSCSDCGCRLEVLENHMFVTMRHFYGFDGRDAWGCKCPSVDLEVSRLIKSISHLGYC